MFGSVRCDNFCEEREVFFFKQKTAYEMLRSLVGSEMCIRDRVCSPGLDRPLKKEKDFIRYAGYDVEIKLYKPLNLSLIHI